MSSAVRAGLACAWRRPRLVLTLWLLNLALALAFGLPGWLSLREALAHLPGTDALAHGLALGVLADLVELRPELLRGLALAALGAAVAGLLAGVALTGGTLEVLTRGQAGDGPLALVLGRGAGRFFWRFLRAGLVVGLVAVPLAGLAAGALAPGAAWLRESSDSEVVALASLVPAPLAAGLVALLALLVLDATRVHIARGDAPKVFPALRAGLGLVLRRPVLWIGTWGVHALLLVLVLVLCLASGRSLPAEGGAGLLVLLALQQAAALGRAWLRVALLGSELTLVGPPEAPSNPAAEPALASLPEVLGGEPGVGWR